MPQDRTQTPVRGILALAQAIPVLKHRVPVGEKPAPRPHVVLHPDVVAQDLTAPAVVVARNPEDRDSLIDQAGELAQHADARPRHYVAPLKPEVEQVAVNDQRLRIGRQLTEEVQQSPLGVGRGHAKVRIGDHITGRRKHRRILRDGRALYKRRRIPVDSPPMESHSEIRVRYAESDQMGVAYHANYLIWCEVGRTDFIRELGMTYAEMERQGVLLAVADAHVRFHASARYDDRVRIATRLTGVRSRMLTFAYDISRLAPDGSVEERLASASTTLVALDADGKPAALPSTIRALLARATTEAT